MVVEVSILLLSFSLWVSYTHTYTNQNNFLLPGSSLTPQTKRVRGDVSRRWGARQAA